MMRAEEHAHVLLRGGRVVDPQLGLDEVTDVLVSGDTIAAVGTDLEVPEGTFVVECVEKVVLPGLIDVHVHLRQPGLRVQGDDRERDARGGSRRIHRCVRDAQHRADRG